MKIFSKHFINTVLSPNDIPGLSKSERKKVCRISTAIRLGSFGVIPLICYIIKKSGCFSTKTSSASLSSRKISQTSSSSVPDVVSDKVKPSLPKPSQTNQSSDSRERSNSSFSVSPIGEIEVPEYLDIKKREWLTNVHLHKYFDYLGAKYPHVFFFQEASHSLIKSTEIEEKISQFDIASSKATAFPFFIQVGGNHWTLVYIDKEKRTVEYFDSMRNYGDLTAIETELNSLAITLSEKEPDQEPYQFTNKTKTKVQGDTYQCGVWLLYFLNKRIQHSHFDVNQIDLSKTSKIITNFRKKVRLKLAQIDRAYTEVYQYKEAHYTTKFGEEKGLKLFRAKVNKITQFSQKDSLIRKKWLRKWYQLKKAGIL